MIIKNVYYKIIINLVDQICLDSKNSFNNELY